MNELAIRHDAAIMPLMTVQEAVARYNAVVEFTKTVMKQGKDYGSVPGTDKQTLLKPGSEKLCSLFGLAPSFVVVDKIVDFEKGLFYFQYRCELTRNGLLVGSGVGSCNSKETKYRYRYQAAGYKPEKAEADKMKAQKLGKWGKNGDAWIWLERVENDEPFDLLNTIDKMAQKRSLIAATLIATNASEFFTQDLEDIDYLEAEVINTTTVQPTGDNSHTKVEAKSEPIKTHTTGAPTISPKMLVDEGLADNVPNASQIINLLGIAGKPADVGLPRVKLYRRWRDAGLDSKDAAAKVIAGEVPQAETA